MWSSLLFQSEETLDKCSVQRNRCSAACAHNHATLIGSERFDIFTQVQCRQIFQIWAQHNLGFVLLHSDPYCLTAFRLKLNTWKHLNIRLQHPRILPLHNEQHNILSDLCFYKVFLHCPEGWHISNPPLTERLLTVFHTNLASAVFLGGWSSFLERAGSAEKHCGGDIKGDYN